ncbi:tryptophan synthase subunit alpha [Marinobacterium jannaschii]|uniref:tryptophan synthase subunit alpha n=1 Tax=Marinobacterium jannaschii TaxID=64970 RepID=UPI00048976F9|nr:tryptophan synthase subunit alpha [Marinobacterium jannaschii]
MSSLQKYIIDQRESKPILLMTHVVYGYPTVADSLQLMASLLEQGVEFLEVQFPFSDPVADGPAITAACHAAVENKPELAQYLVDMAKLKTAYPDSRILMMSYLNPLYRFGLDRVVCLARGVISGFIIPDLPLEMGQQFADECINADIAPIWLATPDTDEERLKVVGKAAYGMLYCVSRRGVTGQHTDQLNDLSSYLQRVKAHVDVPLGVGFGIQSPQDVADLTGQADIAILGSALLNAFNQGGIPAVQQLVASLR